MTPRLLLLLLLLGQAREREQAQAHMKQQWGLHRRLQLVSG